MRDTIFCQKKKIQPNSRSSAPWSASSNDTVKSRLVRESSSSLPRKRNSKIRIKTAKTTIMLKYKHLSQPSNKICWEIRTRSKILRMKSKIYSMWRHLQSRRNTIWMLTKSYILNMLRLGIIMTNRQMIAFISSNLLSLRTKLTLIIMTMWLVQMRDWMDLIYHKRYIAKKAPILKRYYERYNKRYKMSKRYNKILYLLGKGTMIMKRYNMKRYKIN